MTLPTILLPGDGKSVVMGNSSCTFKVTGKDTHGHFGLFEFSLAPETGGASLHIHKQMVEIFYVLAGEVELTLGERTLVAGPGTVMTVPENTPHGFSNPSPQPAKLLIMFCPDNSREKYFEGIAELRKDGRQPSQEELQAWARQFDQYPADEA